MLERNCALDLARPPQLLGALVELGVQRDHAAIGVLELGVDLLELAACLLEIGEGAQQVAILDLYLFRQGTKASRSSARQ